MSQKDAELIQKARNGEVDAVRELIETRYPDIYRFCRCMLGSQADAEAATRQVLGLALTGGGVDSTVDGLALEISRSWIDHRHHVSLPPDEHGEGDRHGEAATESDDVRLTAAIDRLPLDLRVPLLHHDLCGLAAGESCRLLGISDQFLAMRLENARLRVAEDAGIAPEAVDDRVREVLRAMPIPEEHRGAVLEQALGTREESGVGVAVVTAVLAAVAFVAAILIFST